MFVPDPGTYLGVAGFGLVVRDESTDDGDYHYIAVGWGGVEFLALWSFVGFVGGVYYGN